MNEIIVESEVEVGGEVEVGADFPFGATTQMGRVIPWPMSSTPHASHGRQCLNGIMRSWMLFLLFILLVSL